MSGSRPDRAIMDQNKLMLHFIRYAEERTRWYDLPIGGRMAPLGPFVVRNNDSESSYLHVEDGHAYWGVFENATIFHDFATLINFVIRAVYQRPENWTYKNRYWELLEVTIEPPVVPKYRLTGRAL